MTELEKYNAWKAANPHSTLRVSWNPKGIAEAFGGTLRRRETEDELSSLIIASDDYPTMFSHWVDFGDNPPSRDELQEYFAKQMNIIINSLKDGVPFTFYDEHDPLSRLEGLVRTLRDAHKSGKKSINIDHINQAADDIEYMLGELGHRVKYDETIDVF